MSGQELGTDCKFIFTRSIGMRGLCDFRLLASKLLQSFSVVKNVFLSKNDDNPPDCS